MLLLLLLLLLLAWQLLSASQPSGCQPPTIVHTFYCITV
jgi:hypothetical protein